MNSPLKKPPVQFTLDHIVFIQKITIGSINPQVPFSNEEHDKQLEKLNKCLTEYPKGKIIGRDVSIGTYQLGEHQMTMQKTTYHIGFTRKPYWIIEEEKQH